LCQLTETTHAAALHALYHISLLLVCETTLCKAQDAEYSAVKADAVPDVMHGQPFSACQLLLYYC
jgi:hypothetical protein